MRVLCQRVLILCLVFNAFCVVAKAQVSPVQVRVLFLDESKTAYFIKEGDGYQSVSPYPYSISPAFEVSPRSPREVFKEVKFVDDSGEERSRYVEIAQIEVEGDASSVLAVVAFKGSDQYQVRYYSENEDEFPSGTVRVINLGQKPIAASVGGGVFPLVPGEAKLMEPKLDHKRRFFTRVAEKDSEQWNILYDDVTILRANERMTGLVVYSPSGMRHTYTESEILEYGPPPPGHYWLSYSDSIREKN